MQEVDIYIRGFAPDQPESPERGLHRVFGLDERVAAELVRSLPRVVKRNVRQDHAPRYEAALRELGADFELRPSPIRPQQIIAVAGGSPQEPAPLRGDTMTLPPPASPSSRPPPKPRPGTTAATVVGATPPAAQHPPSGPVVEADRTLIDERPPVFDPEDDPGRTLRESVPPSAPAGTRRPPEETLREAPAPRDPSTVREVPFAPGPGDALRDFDAVARGGDDRDLYGDFADVPEGRAPEPDDAGDWDALARGGAVADRRPEADAWAPLQAARRSDDADAGGEARPAWLVDERDFRSGPLAPHGGPRSGAPASPVPGPGRLAVEHGYMGEAADSEPPPHVSAGGGGGLEIDSEAPRPARRGQPAAVGVGEGAPAGPSAGAAAVAGAGGLLPFTVQSHSRPPAARVAAPPGVGPMTRPAADDEEPPYVLRLALRAVIGLSLFLLMTTGRQCRAFGNEVDEELAAWPGYVGPDGALEAAEIEGVSTDSVHGPEAAAWLEHPRHTMQNPDKDAVRGLVRSLKQAGAQGVYVGDIQPSGLFQVGSVLVVELPGERGARRAVLDAWAAYLKARSGGALEPRVEDPRGNIMRISP
ncbi:MAG: hypothetical protein PVI30_11770 [Myxococcales bacterium]